MKRWTPTRARALVRHHGPRSLIFRRRVAMVGGAISIGLMAWVAGTVAICLFEAMEKPRHGSREEEKQ